jgi:predicted RNase H-like HicB family nuclease
MNNREFTAVYQKEGSWITAWIEEVPGANTQARTMKEAKENLREALLMVLEYNRKIAQRKQSVPVERRAFRIAVPA